MRDERLPDHRSVIATTLIFLAIGCDAGGPTTADPAALLERAGELHYRGRSEEALAALRPLLELESGPPSLDAILLASRCHAARGDDEAAACLLASTLERDPFASAAYEELARNRFRLDRRWEGEVFLAAARLCDSRAARRQGYPENHAHRPSAPLVKLAMVLADRGSLWEAIRGLEEARRAAEPTPLLLGSLGSLHARVHRDHEAAADLRACLETPGGARLPAAPLLRLQLATVLARLATDGTEALAALHRLREATAEGEERRRFDLHVVSLLLDPLGLPQEAARLLAEVAGAAGPSEEVVFLTVRLILRAGRPAEALEFLAEAWPEASGGGDQVADGADPLRTAVVRFLARHPALPGGQLLLAELEGRRGGETLRRAALAEAFELRRLRDERDEILRELRESPMDAAGPMYLRLALNSHRSGLVTEARDMLEMARGLSPGDVAVHRAYERVRDRPEEVFFVQRSRRAILALLPGDAEALEGLRRTRTTLGLPEECP